MMKIKKRLKINKKVCVVTNYNKIKNLSKQIRKRNKMFQKADKIIKNKLQIKFRINQLNQNKIMMNQTASIRIKVIHKIFKNQIGNLSIIKK